MMGRFGEFSGLGFGGLIAMICFFGVWYIMGAYLVVDFVAGLAFVVGLVESKSAATWFGWISYSLVFLILMYKLVKT